MTGRGRAELIAACALAVLYAVGAAGHLLDPLRPLMLDLTPVVLLVCGAAAFLPAAAEGGGRFLAWAGAVLLVTLALEAAGTATGAVFGAYTYGKTLGPGLLSVPLVIAFNWLLVIVAGLGLAERLGRPAWLAALLAGLAAALFDFVMEPVAVALEYWRWHEATIPPRNYLAWFLIAASAALVFRLLGLSLRTRLPLIYGGIQLLFFLVLRVALI